METLDPMDASARSARQELEQSWEKWSVRAVAEWWHRWYPSAGHKRLGRILIDVTGVRRMDGVPLDD